MPSMTYFLCAATIGRAKEVGGERHLSALLGKALDIGIKKLELPHLADGYSVGLQRNRRENASATRIKVSNDAFGVLERLDGLGTGYSRTAVVESAIRLGLGIGQGPFDTAQAALRLRDLLPPATEVEPEPHEIEVGVGAEVSRGETEAPGDHEAAPDPVVRDDDSSVGEDSDRL